MILFSTTKKKKVLYSVILLYLWSFFWNKGGFQKNYQKCYAFFVSFCHTFLLVVNENEQKLWWHTTAKLSLGWSHYTQSLAACLSLQPYFMVIGPKPISICGKYINLPSSVMWDWAGGDQHLWWEAQPGVLPAPALRETM